MELCSDGHEEVCYETKHCPACALLDELEDAKKRITELEADVERLNNE